ncbi:hypothetical protein SASPL_121605 [Salvia splendens]|uniref:Transmembrane protein n=1 Tax=Salvia splendens TaxID=180675 RepID=A0A8X8XRU0_SALSN|nr:uncharacterized protein LOC121810794 [Salvia splendens]KAG6419385.1 hypothetical protein SASPL_121605 [Salvia splendens]
MNKILLQFVAAVALSALLGRSAARDLRPSDHGLEFQESSSSPPPRDGGAEEQQEMMAFFGETTSSATVQLPEAKNISDTWLGARAGERARDESRRDHVRLGLLVATAVCGLTGVALLAISGAVFIFRLRKTDRNSSSLPPIHAEKKISG